MLCPNREECKKCGAQIEYLERIEKLRNSYKPEKVHVLFIAESPPEQKNKKIKFFYNPNYEGESALYSCLKTGLVKGDFTEFRETNKENFLKTFKSKGFYLTDAIKCPIVKSAKKRKLAAMCKENLLKEIGEVEPKIIFILGKTALNLFIKSGKIKDYHAKILTKEQKQVPFLSQLNTLTKYIIVSALPFPRNKHLNLEVPFKNLKKVLESDAKIVKSE